MTESDEGPVLAFQSKSYPASLASDPGAEKRGDHGEKLLRYLLSGLPEQAFRVQGEPVSEGSGVGHVIETQSGSVAIHLTWYPAGKESRDTWTIQLCRTGAGLRDMLRGLFGSPEVTGPLVDSVGSALVRLMQERPEEFTEVRWTTWKALEPQRKRPAEWRSGVVEVLGDIADVDAQRSFWVDGVGRPVPDPTELVCQLFDDTALSIELASGRVFSEECDELLRKLGRLCDAAPLSGKPADIVATPEWREIVSVADAARKCINAL